jgi:uncharacterized protein
MRALLDVNILISYLLNPSRPGTITTVVEAAVSGTFTLLVMDDLLQELAGKVASKPWLAQRITPSQVEQLASTLLEVGEIVPSITEPIPATSRDRKDDYLLAYGVVGRANYLVTGDDDLLAIDEIDGLKIVSPAAFAAILQRDATQRISGTATEDE